MRVVSFVPSWTETLLFAGVEVIGRTRFCVHPHQRVKDIPIVGGTKDWRWEKILALKPDLLLLDQEENPRFMSEQSALRWHATHVKSIADMPETLNTLGRLFANSTMTDLAQRWERVLARPKCHFAGDAIPGLIEWGRKPSGSVKNILYLIWKNPWMTVSRDTFIGSVLANFGLELPQFDSKYPALDLNQFDPKETLLLLSSEPYPFFKKKKEMSESIYPHAFVDGEALSWFGLRTLQFLENAIEGARP